jgi:uncharacterized protein (DUF58 family)
VAPALASPALFAEVAELIRLRHAAAQLRHFPKINARAQLVGSQRSRFRGRGMDFDEVRLYQPGDDIRAIDWRVTARTQVAHTKLYREERERPIVVLCDLRPPMLFGSCGLKSVLACEAAALLCWAGLAANDQVGGIVAGPEHQADIRPRRSAHAVLDYLHRLSEASQALTAAQPSAPATLAELLGETKKIVKPGTSLFVISDFNDIDDSCQRHFSELSRHANVTLLSVSDPLEQQLPAHGRFAITDGGEPITFNAADADLQQRFRRARDQQQTLLTQVVERYRAAHIALTTAEPALAPLGRAYGRAGRQARPTAG